jgi:mono/diheme cytochrome c family protein
MNLRTRTILGLLAVPCAAAGCAGRAPGKIPEATPAAVAGVAGDCKRLAPAPLITRVGEARQGSTVALGKIGERTVALVADEDARAVVMIDVDRRAEIAKTPLSGAPSQLLVTADGRVLVALRDADKIAVLEPQAAAPAGPLASRCEVRTPTEPVALAATPDDETVMVTSGFTHALTGFAAATLEKRFEVDLPREPRAVVVSGDGKRAFVAHAVGGKMSVVDLERAFHPVKQVGLRSPNAEPRLTSCQGYALARFEGPGGRVLAPEVVVDPGDPEQRTDGYGDGNNPPERAAVAVLDEAHGEPIADSLDGVTEDDPTAPASDRTVDCLLPRAAAVDAASHTLLVACYGIDAVIAYDAVAPVPARAPMRRYSVASGPSGIAVDPKAGRAVVWSQFERVLGVLPVRGVDPLDELKAGGAKVERVALAPIQVSAEQYKRQIGRQLFHAVNDSRISADGRACASCHPDGRDDAITWATPDGPRRSVMLAGKLAGTAPFGWSGASQDVREHLGHTFERLKGTGLGGLEREALVAYIEGLAPPAAPRPPGDLVARGSAIFHSEEAACARCHRDDQAFTDGLRHDVGSKASADRTASFDTPTLRSVAAHAPYFHDGRYATLKDLLRATDTKMGATKHLTEADLDALEAYLRSL